MIEARHGGSFSDPLVCGKYFSVSMTLDATFKGMGRNLLSYNYPLERDYYFYFCFIVKFT